MSISKHVIKLLDHGKICSDTIGAPAIKVWSGHFGSKKRPGASHLLVVFDRRDAEHPLPVASVMNSHDAKRGGLEQQAEQLLRGSRRQADGRTSCVHDFRGTLHGHRLVIISDGDIPDDLLPKMMNRCVNSVLAHRDQLVA